MSRHSINEPQLGRHLFCHLQAKCEGQGRLSFPLDDHVVDLWAVAVTGMETVLRRLLILRLRVGGIEPPFPAKLTHAFDGRSHLTLPGRVTSTCNDIANYSYLLSAD